MGKTWTPEPMLTPMELHQAHLAAARDLRHGCVSQIAPATVPEVVREQWLTQYRCEISRLMRVREINATLRAVPAAELVAI